MFAYIYLAVLFVSFEKNARIYNIPISTQVNKSDNESDRILWDPTIRQDMIIGKQRILVG